MKHLLNTLFVTTEDVYLTLEGENVVANRGNDKVARYPLHNLQNIVTFSYAGASPALMGACSEKNVNITFCTPNGKFLARITDVRNGNVLLRREQYRIADDSNRSALIGRNMIFGKLYNSRWCLERGLRDHKDRVNQNVLVCSIEALKTDLKQVRMIDTVESIMGVEGAGATAYFRAFDQLLLRDKDFFFFDKRTRRPPLDRINAMLSFSYSILVSECASALESVGLDAYVGFLHQDKPGRKSLALDIMEELRSCYADRFVITAVNNRIIQPDDFLTAESGAVRMTDDGRKKFLKAWQERKQDTITHPFLKEKMKWGLVPYIQSLLLARHIRGDLDEYPPFLWK